MKLGLNLKGLPTPNVEMPSTSRSNVLEILLAILSGVLGALLVALAVIYFMKGRSYRRQIDVLTTSTFGSNSSELNRNIKPLPNTNVFANERSNPVMNSNNMSKVELDTQSIISSDSDDFAGLDNNPIFNISNNSQSNNPLGQKLRDMEPSSSTFI